MPSGFYVLARYWLRLDHVVVRLHETRIHHLFGSDHMIREYTRKEEQFATLFDAGHPRNMSNYTNIDTFQHLLPIQEALYEKIYIE
jgi:type 2A phosphatase activator TIP41